MTAPQDVIKWMLSNPQRVAEQELQHVNEQIEYLEQRRLAGMVDRHVSIKHFQVIAHELLALYKYRDELKTELEFY